MNSAKLPHNYSKRIFFPLNFCFNICQQNSYRQRWEGSGNGFEQLVKNKRWPKSLNECVLTLHLATSLPVVAQSVLKHPTGGRNVIGFVLLHFLSKVVTTGLGRKRLATPVVTLLLIR